MKHTRTCSAALLSILLLAAPASFAANAQSAAAESVVLTNLDDAEAPAPAAPTAQSAAPVAEPKLTVQGKRALAKAKGKNKTSDEQSEEDSAQTPTDESAQTADSSDSNSERAPVARSDEPVRAGNNGYYGGGVASQGYYDNSNIGYNTDANSAGAAGGTNTGSGTASGSTTTASNTPASGTPATTPRAGNVGAVTQTPGVDPALSSTLAQYRALMLQEANYGSLANTNPSISRRYLAVDRSTYQTRVGQ